MNLLLPVGIMMIEIRIGPEVLLVSIGITWMKVSSWFINYDPGQALVALLVELYSYGNVENS